jgi:hypothetical protein
MLHRLFLSFTLALLFGLGQQGAAVHAISHFADWQQDQEQPDKGQHQSTCDKCVVYAELGSAVGTQHFVLPTQDTTASAMIGSCFLPAIRPATHTPPALHPRSPEIHSTCP